MSFECLSHQRVTEDRRKARDQTLCVTLLLVEGEPHAESKLRVVFEQRVGPRWAATLLVLRVRSRWQVAAVDRGAAGRVRDVETVAKELRQQLDVRRFAATSAGAGEFKQRLQQLDVLHLRMREPAAIDFRNGEEEVPVRRALLRAAAPAFPC